MKPDHTAKRLEVLDTLREELFGPVSVFQARCQPNARVTSSVGCSWNPCDKVFDKAEDAYGPFFQADNGQEVLLRDPPCKRYGIGVLYPRGRTFVQSGLNYDAEDAEPEADDTEVFSKKAQEALRQMAENVSGPRGDENDDFDLSGANDYRQSCLGISFLALLPPDARLRVQLTGGRYRAKSVRVAGQDRQWWLRDPVEQKLDFHSSGLIGEHRRVQKETIQLPGDGPQMTLEFRLLCRPSANPGEYLLTLCLINTSPSAGAFSHDTCLFQTFLAVSAESDDGDAKILPYRELAASEDSEEQSIKLLYRNCPTFAIGHGCAAGWGQAEDSGASKFYIFADCLPTCEVPHTTPDITTPDDRQLVVSMKDLAGLNPSNDGRKQLTDLVTEYEQWIARMRDERRRLPEHYRQTADKHLSECEICLERMKQGLEVLRQPIVAEAFRLANHAILLQQHQSRLELRDATLDEEAQKIVFSRPFSQPSLDQELSGTWRAFQVAFLLMNLESSISEGAPHRETVELIWFPTGGGKTEAYLGLSAFSMFVRRLKNPLDSGTHVLMRYTLRLLTAQQFQRAASLICAMEVIRRTKPGLGNTPFSIGIWVGRETTPNTRDSAKEMLSALQGDARKENPFLLGRCPWCAAKMGPIEHTGSKPAYKRSRYSRRKRGSGATILGYAPLDGTVVMSCPDRSCPFSEHLPVLVIDEDIYEMPPSIVIGTVDKFASLAWRPQARSLFGLDLDGKRISSPPGLIIQDELHLIAGPLGSMVGLFEGVVEELCTDHRDELCRPKIIASTATIRRYREQILALYARQSVQLFPPPGLEAGDSFFAVQVVNKPGKLYVGVNAPGLGSMQTTQVRSFTALLQASSCFSPTERDPWWTLLVFFNSLRELGTTVSLFQSDIPDYFKAYRNRRGLKETRWVNEVKELTGRLRRDQVPKAIEELEIRTNSDGTKKPVDVCLASNIIEVGVDIPRLSLMAVVGQPKTTSQYIQVTGRVGRDWPDRPGLVVTLYSASKPRDRSHFEKFRTYHERLYAEVEPTSVTPFSFPCLERALHAVMVSYVRQNGSRSAASSPEPFPAEAISTIYQIMRNRVLQIDPDELDNFEEFFSRRVREWKGWERTKWTREGLEAEPGLLRAAGEYAPQDHVRLSWATPLSMRNVDAECQAEITTLYLGEGDN